MTRTIFCGSCNGSGFHMGTYGDIECVDCSGEGQWESQDDDDSGITLAELREKYGTLDLTECLSDPARHLGDPSGPGWSGSAPSRVSPSHPYRKDEAA